MSKTYTTGSCPCCKKTDLIISNSKIICRFCNDWAWIEDAYNSSFLKEVSSENNIKAEN